MFRHLTYQFRVGVNDLLDTLASKGLLTESPFDIIQNFRMCRVSFVQNVPELVIRRPQTITEMLRENPATICRNI